MIRECSLALPDPTREGQGTCAIGFGSNWVLAVATRYRELVIENMKKKCLVVSVGQATITQTFPISRY